MGTQPQVLPAVIHLVPGDMIHVLSSMRTKQQDMQEKHAVSLFHAPGDIPGHISAAGNTPGAETGHQRKIRGINQEKAAVPEEDSVKQTVRRQLVSVSDRARLLVGNKKSARRRLCKAVAYIFRKLSTPGINANCEPQSHFI